MARKKLPVKLGALGAISVRWPTVLAGGLAAALLTAVYTFHLRRLVPVGPSEQYTLNNLHTLGGLINDPLLLVYKLPATALQQVFPDSLLAARLAAVLVGVSSCFLFYLLARRWYGRLHGAGITLLFALSSWMLHTSRYAAGYGVLILLVLALLNVVVWTNSSERPTRTLLVFAAACALAMFAPGGIWFAIAAALLCRQALTDHFKAAKLSIRLAVVGVLVIAVAIIAAASLHIPDTIPQIFGIPDTFPSLAALGKQAALTVSAFLVRGPGTPEIWLAHTPILDVASVALLLLGIVFYCQHLRKPRTLLLLVFGGIAAALISLNGASALGYLVPIVYLVVGGGLWYLMYKWKKVFPRNPIAEATASTALGLLLLCIVAFHTQRYFIAWHYSPVTSDLYYQKPGGSPKLPYLIQ